MGVGVFSGGVVYEHRAAPLDAVHVSSGRERDVLTEYVDPFVPVLIVTFRNTHDVIACVRAVAQLQVDPHPVVFICENGGAEAYAALVAALTGPLGGALDEGATHPAAAESFTKSVTITIRPDGAAAPLAIHVGCATENLGYAGGVNAWLRPLFANHVWPGAWVLNPDTEPQPEALQALIDFATEHGKGMVGSRLVTQAHPSIVHCRGLAWSRLRGLTKSVDMFMPTEICLPPAEQDGRLDAPAGASVYVTRPCLERVGLMDERYFLFFEDLDWGIRAKQCCGVGYAHKSVVVHEGGTTIGTATTRRHQSPLAVYLDFRNRLLFVRVHHLAWLPWTAVMALADASLYAVTGRSKNVIPALRGLFAGLAGESGRPEGMVQAHIAAVASRPQPD